MTESSPTYGNSGPPTDRLDRVEFLLTQMAENQAKFEAQSATAKAESDERMAKLEESLKATQAICDSNARAIEALGNRSTEQNEANISADFDLHEDIDGLRTEMSDGFAQLTQLMQTVANAVFSILKEMRNQQRRAS